ncbi:hypothetical protein LEP1GSC025_0541 [Leptospira interrogans str. 2002000621]|nr:hypothetical protein LEP1GSC027_4227 [Leptospira interrogans str. 2002000624]EKQ39034.1 hypothetical protein LEP1GSC025_0541 [Leptospira interrogans str. 2002000621]
MNFGKFSFLIRFSGIRARFLLIKDSTIIHPNDWIILDN